MTKGECESTPSPRADRGTPLFVGSDVRCSTLPAWCGLGRSRGDRRHTRQLEVDEATRRKHELQEREARMAGRKSLAQQLAENREAHDEEWKRTHNPFQPPPGVDEDEWEVGLLGFVPSHTHTHARTHSTHKLTGTSRAMVWF